MRRYILPFILVAALPAARAAAQALPPALPDEVGLSAPRLALIDRLLEESVARGEIAGVVTLVARHGRLVAIDSAGFQDLARRTPMGAGTLFRIGSMTKAVTSAAALILVEEGRLRLADPVARFIPAFANASVALAPRDPDDRSPPTLVPARRPITVRDLLTHQSGITYGFMDEGPVGDRYRAAGVSDGIALRDEPIAANVERLAALPLAAHPGTEFRYGLSTDVLGRVIEVASGETLAEFLRQRLFEPLGMADTRFYVDDARLARLAVPYTLERGRLRPIGATERFGGLLLAGVGYRGSERYFSGGSGLVSTAGDYARFLQMILNGGELDGVRVLSPKSVERLTTDASGNLATLPLGPGTGFSLGFQVITDLGRSPEPGSNGTISWSGIYGTSFWADPEEQLIGIVMLQLFPSRAITLDERVRAIVYGAVTD
jgi:CubicO group peptidase (beta-lactamase class C family)